MDPAMRGLVDGGCWVGHPTEWGGEDNVVPPPAMGRRRGGPRPKGQGLDEGYIRTSWHRVP